MRDSQSFEYDLQKRSRAVTAATLRAAVALYIVYLGWSIIKGVREGSTTMAPWLGWTAGLFFIAAALGFAFYAWRRFLREQEAARLPVSAAAAGEEPETEEDGHDGAE